MTLSILLTSPWDVRADTMPRDVAKVTPHRFSWKRAGVVGHPRSPWKLVPQRPDTSDDGGASDEAMVAAWIDRDDAYAGIVDTLRAIGAQHPDAMWLVPARWVDDVAE
jgi:hypothetical protein